MTRNMRSALAAALALCAVAAPLQAQQLMSDSFSFLEAVRKRDGAKATKFLAEPGTQVVNTRDRSSGDGGIHIVTRGRDGNWLAFLLGKGARPDLQNREGNTALALAAQIGWAEGAQALLGRRASVDLPNNRGETPLIHAVLGRDMAMVRMLLASGANPRKTDSIAGYSALDYAKRDPRAAGLIKMLEIPVKPAKAVSGPTL